MKENLIFLLFLLSVFMYLYGFWSGVGAPNLWLVLAISHICQALYTLITLSYTYRRDFISYKYVALCIICCILMWLAGCLEQQAIAQHATKWFQRLKWWWELKVMCTILSVLPVNSATTGEHWCDCIGYCHFLRYIQHKYHCWQKKGSVILSFYSNISMQGSKLILTQLISDFSAFMEARCSVICSQEPSTGPCPEAYHIPSPCTQNCFFKIHLDVIVPCTSLSSKRSLTFTSLC
jgi:hypothetical protein